MTQAHQITTGETQLNASCRTHFSAALSVGVRLATACVVLAVSGCAITEIRDSDNRSSWSLHVLRDAGSSVGTSGLTYVRSRALGWQQTGSDYAFGLMWREAVISRDANACALVVLLDASRADAATVAEHAHFYSTVGNCQVVPLSKG